MATTSEQLLIDATLAINKLQEWIYALSLRTLYYKNGDAAWANQPAVLAGIPEADREQYMLVNIAGVEYWFDGSPLALVQVATSQSIANGSITLAKLANMAGISVLGRSTATTGVPEVITLAALKILLEVPDTPDLTGKVDKATGYSLVLNTEIAKIHTAGSDNQDLSGLVEKITGSSLITDTEKTRLSTIVGPQQINLPAGNLTTKIAGASFLPIAWATIAVNSTTNAMITHTLTGRKIGFVNVYEIDGANERLLSFDKGTAYTGILANGLTVLIEGIAPTTLPIRVELIFD